METLTVYGDAGDGYIESSDAVYATAAAGNNLTVSTSATGLLVGQFLTSSYYIHQSFIKFDTSSLPGGATIDHSDLYFTVYGNHSNTDFTLQVKAYFTWGTLDTSDWRTPTQLTALTTTAGISTANFTTGELDLLVGGVTKAGTTYYLLNSSLNASGTAPTVDEYLEIRSADYAGTTSDPRLVVVYTAPVTVTPASATLTLTGYAPTVRISARVTPASASLTTTRYAPAILTRTLVRPSAASLTTTRYAPTLYFSKIPIPAALLHLTGYAPRVGTGVTPAAASLTLTGFAPTPLIIRFINATAALLQLTTYAPEARGIYRPPPVETPPRGTVQWFRYEQRSNEFGYEYDLTPAIVEASIDLDNTRTIVRTAKFTIDSTKLPESFDLKSSNVSVTGYQLEDGVAVAHVLGTFRLDLQMERFHPNRSPIWEAEGSELTILLQRAIVPAPYTIAAGTEIIATIRTICAEEGLSQDFPYDLSVLPVTHTWDECTSKLTIVNDLLESINWYPAHDMAGEGRITSRPRTMPHEETEAVLYTSLEEPRMILPPFVRKRSRTGIVNRVTVKIEDPSQDVLSFASRENDRPDSPTSTAYMPLTEVEISSGIYQDEATIGLVAEFVLRESVAYSQGATLYTVPDLRRGPHESYTIHIEDVEESTFWRVWGWSLSMETGSVMEHSVGRVTPFYVTAVV
jgi:hypothetical protein